MRAHLSNDTVLQHQDLITIANCAQTVSHEHTGAALIFEDAVDVLEEGLLRVCVESGCLAGISWCSTTTNQLETHCLIEEQKLRILQNQPGDCQSLFFSA